MAIENIRQKRVGQIAVVCTDRERTAEFYGSVFGWEKAFRTESFMGELISEVQGMRNAAASTHWLIDSRPGFQLEIFEYACPESRPLPEDSSVSDQGYNRIIIATRSLAEIVDRMTDLDPQLAAGFTVDETNGKRALARDPDGVLLEIFERPDWVPAADHSVILGVGVTVNDLELFSADLMQGFGFQPEADRFEHAQHWDLDGSLEKCRTLKLGDMFVVASRYRDSRQRPSDYKLGDIGIMNFAVIHPSMAAFKEAYLHTCSLGMRSTSVPQFSHGKAAVVYQNTREGLSVEMLYADTGIWGLIGFSRASWLDHMLDAIATWKARREYHKYVARGEA